MTLRLVPSPEEPESPGDPDETWDACAKELMGASSWLATTLIMVRMQACHARRWPCRGEDWTERFRKTVSRAHGTKSTLCKRTAVGRELQRLLGDVLLRKTLGTPIANEPRLFTAIGGERSEHLSPIEAAQVISIALEGAGATAARKAAETYAAVAVERRVAEEEAAREAGTVDVHLVEDEPEEDEEDAPTEKDTVQRLSENETPETLTVQDFEEELEELLERYYDVVEDEDLHATMREAIRAREALATD